MRPTENGFMEKMGVSEFGTPDELLEEKVDEEIIYEWNGSDLDEDEQNEGRNEPGIYPGSQRRADTLA